MRCTGQGQSLWFHVRIDYGAAACHGPIADCDWCYQHRVGPDENVSANVCMMLHHTVIVAGDRARADVAAFPDRGVADVGQVIYFSTFRDGGVFHFDKIADAHVFGQFRTGAQTGIGADDTSS